MRSHEILGHIADVRMKVEGDSLEELFTAAVEGMAGIIKRNGCTSFQPDHEVAVTVASRDTTMLLIDFLSEVLTHSHINEAIYCSVEIHEFSESSMRCTLVGKKISSFDEDIKAVTYHEADVIKNKKDNFETLIIFDI